MLPKPMMLLGALLLTVITLATLLVLVARASLATARRCWLVAFAIIAGGAITMEAAHAFVAKWAYRGDNPRDGLFAMMDGTAMRPFVYRRLAPEIVRVTTDVAERNLPASAIRSLRDESLLGRYRYYGNESWTERKAIAFHVAYALTWASMFATFLAGAALHRALRPRCGWLEALATAAVVMGVSPLMFALGGYMYDAPELLLWTLLLLLAVRGWTWGMPFVFALMLFNKETAVLAIVALLPILVQRQGRRAAALWSLAFGVMGAGWLWYVRNRYAACPGEGVGWYLPRNLKFWSSPLAFLGFSATASPALPLPRGANLLTLILLSFPIRFGWSRVPRDLRWATVLLAVPLVALFLVGGAFDEIRALALLFPLLLVPVVEGVHAMFETATKSATDAAAAGEADEAEETSSVRSRLLRPDAPEARVLGR
jgi:hypothetical protein